MSQNPFRNFLRSSNSLYYFPRVPGLGFGMAVLLLFCTSLVLIPSLPLERTVRVKVELRRQENSSKTRSPYSSPINKVVVRNFDLVKKGDLLFVLESSLLQTELEGLLLELDRMRSRSSSVSTLVDALVSGKSPNFLADMSREFDYVYLSIRAQEDFLSHRIQIAERNLELLRELPRSLQNKTDLELKLLEILSLRKELGQWLLERVSEWEQEQSHLLGEIEGIDLRTQLLAQEIESHNVRAAVDGQVAFLREIQNRDFLAQGEAVLEISAVSQPQTSLRVTIPGRDIALVKPQMPLRVQFYSLKPREWGFGLGRIVAVSPKPESVEENETEYLAEGELLQWTGNFETDLAVASLPAELLGEGLITYDTTTVGDFVLDLLQFGDLLSPSLFY